MTTDQPITELDRRFSGADATATPWAEGRERIEAAELFWISTVRPDGRPHVTPLISVWLDRAAYFCTGSDERKAKNLAANPCCILTTGANQLREGLDLTIEGEAQQLRDEAALRRVAAAYESKYGAEWRFDVHDGAFHGAQGNAAIVFELRPTKILGFAKGAYSQTSWRFE
jgi:pyridoxine/pyridoxamine 5'-phosphate oxidase